MSPWERAFFSVPPDLLILDPVTSRHAPHVPPARLREIVNSIPEVYRLRAQGAGRAEFERLRRDPSPERRLVGETYSHLWGPERLRADFDDRGLLVVKGQHRVQEAQRQGVPLVPIDVSFQDRSRLEALRDRCEARVGRETPELANVIRLDRELNDAFRAEERLRADREQGAVAVGPARMRFDRPR